MKKKANPYGLCSCVQCKSRRGTFKEKINQMKKRLRKWLNGGNKIPKKGLYTD